MPRRRSCRDCETRYLVRTLVQNLRVGASWRSVVPALARTAALHRAAAAGARPLTKAALDTAGAAAADAFHRCPSLDVLVPALLEAGPEGLEARMRLTPGADLSVRETALSCNHAGQDRWRLLRSALRALRSRACSGRRWRICALAVSGRAGRGAWSCMCVWRIAQRHVVAHQGPYGEGVGGAGRRPNALALRAAAGTAHVVARKL